MNQPAIPIDKKLLERYSNLKFEEKQIAEEIELLAPQIKEMMAANDVDKLESDFGNFTMSETTRWKYSEAVEELQEKEKASGVAKRVISTTLRFTVPKV